MSATEKLEPDSAARKVCSQTSFRQRLGDGHLLPACFVLSPGRMAVANTGAIINNCYFVCCGSVKFMNTSRIGFHSWMIWRAFLKNRLLDMRPSLLRENGVGVSF